MFRPFICGAFGPEKEDDRRKSRKNCFCKSKGRKKYDKNPYSDRGLDKFSALLSELEEKRQKIYSQTGSQDISLVRFMYKNSTDFVPIVVKLKDKKEAKKKAIDTSKGHHPGMNVDSRVIDEHLIEGKKIPGLQSVSEKTDEQKKKSFSWNREFHKWRRPSYYLPAFLVLILLLLVFFGRSVSILFTCIGWYIVPTIQGKSYNKKKDYVRKLSDNKTGVARDNSSQIPDHHSGNLMKKII